MDHPACQRCGEELVHRLGQKQCQRCARHPLAIDETVIGFAYRYPVDIMVRRLKYSGALHLAKPLSEGLAQAAAHRPLPDGLMAMPLSRQRRRQRGYNQAHEIALHLARRFGRPLMSGAHRIRDTQAQAGLNFAQRQDNVANAFDCINSFQGQEIAVVDDVMTSGATVDALARVLKAHGARRVTAWVVARTPSPEL